MLFSLEDAMGYMSLRLVYLLNYSMEQGHLFECSGEIPFMGDIIPLCISLCIC